MMLSMGVKSMSRITTGRKALCPAPLREVTPQSLWVYVPIVGVTAVTVEETSDIVFREPSIHRELAEVLTHQLPQPMDHTARGTPDLVGNGEARPHMLAGLVETLQDQPTKAELVVHQIPPPL